MTQVYQHEEDSKRGDITLSIKLGVLGTFHFTAICFAIASASYVWYFASYHELKYGLHFLLALSPVLLFFGWWYLQVRKSATAADFKTPCA